MYRGICCVGKVCPWTESMRCGILEYLLHERWYILCILTLPWQSVLSSCFDVKIKSNAGDTVCPPFVHLSIDSERALCVPTICERSLFPKYWKYVHCVLSVHVLRKGLVGTNGYGNTATVYDPPTETVDFGIGFMPQKLDCGYAHCCAVSTVSTSKCWGYECPQIQWLW